MTPIRSLLQRITLGDELPGRDADMVLGLPLQTDDRTIYPVFLDPHANAQNGAEPQQIGYLELGNGHTDYTSLEPENQWPIAIILAGVAALFLLSVTLLRRSTR